MKPTRSCKSSTMILIAASLLVATALAGCGDDAAGPANQPVDHQSAQLAVQANAQGAADDLAHALGYLRDNAEIGVGQAVNDLGDAAVPNCADIRGEGMPPADDGCTATEPQPVEEQIQEGVDEAVQFLETYVFVEANIEQETATEVTYLIDGATVCAAEDSAAPEELQECIADTDALQLRLVVTSPATGDLNIEVLVGEQRYNPVDFELHGDLVAAEVDFSEARSTIVFAAGALGEDLPELPTVMQGRVRAEYRHSADKVAATVAIQEKITVTGNDWVFNADATSPAARVSLDIPAELLSGMLNLKPVDLRGPITTTEYSYDPMTGLETETTTEFEVLAHLAGATFKADYRLGEERIEVENVGLGDATSTLDIDGNRVMEVDLNADQGRQLGFTVAADGNGGFDLSLSPAFDLKLLLQFAAVQDKLSDIDEWMFDELLRITFDGAAEPTLHVEEGNVEVIDGTLSISSTAADMTVQVNAGQCLLSPEDAPHVGTSEGSTETGDVPVDESASHPLEGLGAGACG